MLGAKEDFAITSQEIDRWEVKLNVVGKFLQEGPCKETMQRKPLQENRPQHNRGRAALQGRVSHAK